MNRRHFIKNTALAIPAFSLAGFLLSSCNRNEPEAALKSRKIGIIGAGISGLQTAKILRDKGFEVEILEAGDRIGGRIQSDDYVFGIGNAELGASLVYGKDSEWHGMLSKHLSHLRNITETQTTYFINGNSASGSDMSGDAAIVQLKSALAGMADYNGSDLTVQDYLEQSAVPEKVRFIFSAMAEEFNGTSAERPSVLLNSQSNARKIEADTYLPSSQSFKSVLLTEFAPVLPYVLTNTPVAEIDYSGERVKVTDKFQKQRIYDSIVVTVPLSILRLNPSQAHAIQFKPELPAYKLEAMNSLGMDSAVRIVLKLKKRLWQEGSKVFYTEGSIRKFEVLKEDMVSNTFIVAATVHGQTAENNLDMKSDAEILDMIRQEWNLFMGPFAGTNISEAKIKHWSKDPYIQGSFSYQKTGGDSNCREKLGRPLQSKVYFAGEACNTNGKSGSVSGAIETAISAAENIIRQFA